MHRRVRKIPSTRLQIDHVVGAVTDDTAREAEGKARHEAGHAQQEVSTRPAAQFADPHRILPTDQQAVRPARRPTKLLMARKLRVPFPGAHSFFPLMKLK